MILHKFIGDRIFLSGANRFGKIDPNNIFIEWLDSFDAGLIMNDDELIKPVDVYEGEKYILIRTAKFLYISNNRENLLDYDENGVFFCKPEFFVQSTQINIVEKPFIVLDSDVVNVSIGSDSFVYLCRDMKLYFYQHTYSQSYNIDNYYSNVLKCNQLEHLKTPILKDVSFTSYLEKNNILFMFHSNDEEIILVYVYKSSPRIMILSSDIMINSIEFYKCNSTGRIFYLYTHNEQKGRVYEIVEWTIKPVSLFNDSVCSVSQWIEKEYGYLNIHYIISGSDYKYSTHTNKSKLIDFYKTVFDKNEFNTFVKHKHDIQNVSLQNYWAIISIGVSKIDIYTTIKQESLKRHMTYDYEEYFIYCFDLDKDILTIETNYNMIRIMKQCGTINMIVLDDIGKTIDIIHDKLQLVGPDIAYVNKLAYGFHSLETGMADVIFINTTRSILEQFIHLMQFGYARLNYYVICCDANGQKHAEGYGAKREMFSRALDEFSQKYLKYDGHYPHFTTLAQKEDNYIIRLIGEFIHHIIISNRTHLPIRLPIPVIEMTTGSKCDIRELEYFANIQDSDTFSNIKNYFKKDSDKIEYRNALKNLCKIYDDDTSVATNMAHGLEYNHFIPDFKNATLDYYLSGPIRINRSSFISTIVVVDDNDHPLDKSIMVTIINDCSEEQLRNLLRNWSGYTSHDSDEYTVKVCKNLEVIKFRSCICYIDIPDCVWRLDNIIHLIEYLCTPIDEIKD